MNDTPALPQVHDPVGVQRLKNWHEMVADFILLNPKATHAEIALHFDVAANTVSRVLNSDLFKMYFERRKLSFYEKVDGTALDRINRKLHGLAERTIDALDEKIQNERLRMGTEEVRETLDTVLKAVGFGSPARTAPPAVQTSVTLVVDRTTLDQARELHAQRRDGEASQGDAARTISISPDAARIPPLEPQVEVLPPLSKEDIDL